MIVDGYTLNTLAFLVDVNGEELNRVPTETLTKLELVVMTEMLWKTEEELVVRVVVVFS